jgi:glycerophosphoryl diester phosphodiesterase
MWPPLKIGQQRPAKETVKNAFSLWDLTLREGAEGIAIEVQLSAEGVPVVICESGLNRRVPSRARVRLLSEVLEWVGGQKCMAFVAIDTSSPGADAKVLREIDRAKVRHLIRVIGSSLADLRRLRQLDPKIYLGWRFAGRPPAIHQAKALGAEVLLPHWTVASPSFIRDAHCASMLVIPWTVDSPRQMRRTILDGVDGIITNDPSKLTATVARLQKTRRLQTS